MRLLWKLLRQHISGLQLLGFFLANLLGVLIVLLGMQFYRDVRPVFSQDDGLIRNDYLILSKRVTTMGMGSTSFSEREQKEIAEQSFTKSMGLFTASQYKVSCSMGIEGVANFGTQMYFESVPDRYIDTDKTQWQYVEGSDFVPIILPRSYLAIYNFGFAQSRSLPKLSEGVVSMIDMVVILRGDGKERRMRGRVIGFTNRLNTILVPQTFMAWSNREFAPESDTAPTRLILEVGNPADERIARFVQDHGYDIDEDKLQAGKATYFLRVMSGIVMSIGLLITALAFFVLMLSVYLLVQKNAEKLQNLLLLGYPRWRVALPYQSLTVMLNLAVLCLAALLVFWLRGVYMRQLWAMFPTLPEASLWPTLLLGIILCFAVSLWGCCAIRKKVSEALRYRS